MSARVPPRWFMKGFWYGHRWLYRLSGGRLGLWRPRPGKWGALRLTVTGRRTGAPRSVMLGYLEDGDDLVTLAMNGWGPAEPAWWLNLQEHPEAMVDLKGGAHAVVARAATGDERERLWTRWQQVDRGLDEFAARRPGATAVVILSPAG